MEISSTSPPGISTARIFLRPSSLFGKYVTTISMPTKMYKRCAHTQNHIPPLSKLNRSSLNLFCQPKSGLPNGRKVIPLAKANGNKIGPYKSALIKVLKFSQVVLRFVKPHVVFGHAVATIAIITRTWMENDHIIMIPKWILILRATTVVVAFVCTIGFMCGINQIYDVDIDKINKPHYPLVSGDLSLQSAWILVISSGTISIAIPILLQSKLLLASILCTHVLALLYSVPPICTKRSTLGALLTCAAGRYVLTLGMAAAARNIMGLPFQLSTPLMFITIFSTLFTFVLGALKDIEDLEGDEKYDVPTLASIYGPKKVAFFGFMSLLLTYAGAIAAFTLMPQVFRRIIMVPTHAVLALCLIIQACKWDKANYSKEVSLVIYESLWKFLTIEFIIFPFI